MEAGFPGGRQPLSIQVRAGMGIRCFGDHRYCRWGPLPPWVGSTGPQRIERRPDGASLLTHVVASGLELHGGADDPVHDRVGRAADPPDFDGTRRVLGMRRTEVASLAGVSIEFYTKVERGTFAGVSQCVLESLDRALQLDEAEREHPFDLARAAGPSPRTRRKPCPPLSTGRATNP